MTRQQQPMPPESSGLPSTDRFRHNVLLVVIAAALLATLIGWFVQGVRAPVSPNLSAVMAVTTAVLSVLLIAAWTKLLPQRVLELCCLLYTVGICVACMALRMYSQKFGAGIQITSLYLWIPLVYVFAFMLTSHKTGLMLSLAILALFVVVSLPYLVFHLDGVYANLTVQLHLLSAIMITMLYFFSSYQHRLRLAQETVGELAHLSNTDELTELPNRRHMAMMIDAELARLAQGGQPFALMLFDIDHFKAINDRSGHGAGDAVLVAVAAHGVEVIHGLGTLGRWGGDEFLALVRGANREDAVRMGDALCAYVASSTIADDRPVTISCGVTIAKRDDTINSMLQRADAALYAAKRDGRNRAASIVEEEKTGD